MTTKSETNKHLLSFESDGSKGTDLIAKLKASNAKTTWRFSKVGGRASGPRATFVALVNRERNAINQAKANKLDLPDVKSLPSDDRVSQYDTIRMIASGEHTASKRNVYAYADKLCNDLSISDRPGDDEIAEAFDIQTEDFATDPRNTYVAWNDIDPNFVQADVLESAEIEA